jgi:hypothetical protein
MNGIRRWFDAKAVAIAGSGVLVACLLLANIIALWNQSRMDRQIRELSRAVNRIARSPADSQDAERAVARGRDAIQQGRWELGQLYFVNAATNAPRDLGHLTAYASAILGKDGAPIDALDRLSSVLQLAAYQVDSGDVPGVLALIEMVEQARKRTLTADGGGEKQSGARDLVGQWERLSKADAGLWKDTSRLASHVKALEDLISAADEQDDAPTGLRTKAADELLRWSEIAQTVKQCGYIDACLDRLRQGEDPSSQRAVAIIQAAENALPGFWGVSPSALPAGLKAKVDGYPERIQALVREIGNARSAAVLKQVRDGLDGEATRTEGQSWQEKCLAIENQLKGAQRLVVQLISADALAEAQKLVEKRTEDLKRCRNNQYYEYQSWVIKKCDAAFRSYMVYRLGLSEADARKVFKEHALAEVDQSLLSPEVSRVFNDVLGKLMAELGPEALVTSEKEMGTTTKKRLEDF